MGRDAITGLVVLAASLVLFWGTFGLERHPMVPVGPEFYPRIVIGVTALLALCLVAADVVAHRRGRAVAAAAKPAHYGTVALAFGVVTAYVIALPFLGFRVATLLFLIAMQVALEPPRGTRRWIAVVVLAILTTAVTYLAFEQYLHVLMPRGRWTGF